MFNEPIILKNKILKIEKNCEDKKFSKSDGREEIPFSKLV